MRPKLTKELDCFETSAATRSQQKAIDSKTDSNRDGHWWMLVNDSAIQQRNSPSLLDVVGHRRKSEWESRMRYSQPKKNQLRWYLQYLM
jgi:hypothetical protein